MELKRRGFLRLMGAAATAVGLVKYAEPIVGMVERGDWIEDRGDFYIVRVPDFKTFKGELLDKPTIFGLGEGATVANVSVMGFANIYAPRGGTFKDSLVDASKMKTLKARSVVLMGEGLSGFVMGSCQMIGNSATTAGIEFPAQPMRLTGHLDASPFFPGRVMVKELST